MFFLEIHIKSDTFYSYVIYEKLSINFFAYYFLCKKCSWRRKWYMLLYGDLKRPFIIKELGFYYRSPFNEVHISYIRKSFVRPSIEKKIFFCMVLFYIRITILEKLSPFFQKFSAHFSSIQIYVNLRAQRILWNLSRLFFACLVRDGRGKLFVILHFHHSNTYLLISFCFLMIR